MALNVNFLDINENECEQRAQSAFSAAGWTDITYKGNTWVRAHKGDFSSYIACNASASGGVAVNIFVAYDGNDPEGNIVGAERDQLKAQMQKPQ